jgi:hypothetical protein
MRVSHPLAGRAAAWYEKSFRLNFERVEMAPPCGVMCGRQTSRERPPAGPLGWAVPVPLVLSLIQVGMKVGAPVPLERFHFAPTGWSHMDARTPRSSRIAMIASAALSGRFAVVSMWISACSGVSYGESMPVKFLSSPRRAFR